MDPQLLHILDTREYLRRRELLAVGYDDRDITRAKRSGQLEAVGAGLYVDPSAAKLWTPEKKHVVTSRAVQHKLGDGVVLSHQSALALHGVSLWDLDLSTVHVTRRDRGRPRTDAGVTHHVGGLDDSHVMEIGGTSVTTPARAVWETVCTVDIEHGLVIADSALHLGLMTREDVITIVDASTHWRGARHAKLTLALADGRAESPGESRSRYLFWRQGVPTPDLQVEVWDEEGHAGRADFGWLDDGHLGEFDGLFKYGDAASGPHAAALVKEKIREDRIRRRGFGMSRLIWRDLSPRRARQTAERVQAEIAESRRRATRGATTIT